ncbi:hypothetical protein COLO4_19997 [Corchorus olitorius]|uniref:Uncharacterized protein n=1 Tax=Corchorus olitorius TaxID=93759 RepID=A0A1R3J2C5_9ROSI|nr:hypothetical protein COLO4_19997 [Corchorus olitorius]
MEYGLLKAIMGSGRLNSKLCHGWAMAFDGLTIFLGSNS